MEHGSWKLFYCHSKLQWQMWEYQDRAWFYWDDEMCIGFRFCQTQEKVVERYQNGSSVNNMGWNGLDLLGLGQRPEGHSSEYVN